MKHFDTVEPIRRDSPEIANARPGAGTVLPGSVLELDSKAVIGVITALDGHFGNAVADGGVEAQRFATVGRPTELALENLSP